MRLFLGVGLLLLGCNSKPPAPWAALPAPGTTLPAFAFELTSGDTLSSDALTGSPVVLALWSTGCHQSRRALAALDTIQRDYRDAGVRVVVLAGDRDRSVLQQVLDSAGVDLPVAVAGRTLWDIFDRSAEAPERSHSRVNFGLPSFVLLDKHGLVADRAAGTEPGAVRLAHVRIRLDSLLARAAR